MSRYIDADAIDKAFSKLRFNNDGELEHYGDRPNWYLWGSEVDNLIADAPSIDLVRCKECRHWCCHNDVDYDQSKFTYYCEVHGISLEGNEYCSFGEREGE